MSSPAWMSVSFELFDVVALQFQEILDSSYGAIGLVHSPTIASSTIVTVGLAAIGVVMVWLIVGALWSTCGSRKRRVCCVESAVFVPPKSWQIDHESQKNIARAQACFNDESAVVMTKCLDNSAIGQTSHMPPLFHNSKDGKTKMICNMTSSREEAESIIFPIVQGLLDAADLRPRDIDFLIVNCSLFVPTPSICAMICNKFGLRQDVRTYNLGGMGCSANVISVDLARQLLENAPGSRALVVSTEIITPNFYLGNDKSMLLQNTLFRAGGAALILSSRRSDFGRAKFELLFSGRSQISDDAAYGAVYLREDEDGKRGVALSKDIVKVASRAMTAQFTQLGTAVLPVSEQLKVVLNRAKVNLVKLARKAGLTQTPVPRPGIPDFSRAVEHFCIHAGGRAVIDGVQKALGLSDHHMEASKQTLYDWGNTSSSSIWYEMEWLERFGAMRKGDRILQLTFGSGFKCNSAVWRVLRVDGCKRGVPIKSVAKDELGTASC